MSMKLGDFELTALRDGFFRLDGGSMFGVVPRTNWEKQKPPDERNRINLGLNVLLVQTPDATLLLEAGIGEKVEGKGIDLYDLRQEEPLPAKLEALGVRPEDVDFVILSHLHLDHCGWSTRRQGEAWVPTFPKARYLLQSREWEAAQKPDLRSRPSYDPRNYDALEQSGLRAPVDGDTQVVPGVKLRHTGGHTAGHQVTYLESGGERLIFLGDIVPTFAHLRTNWHMGWDLWPLEVMARKERLLQEALRSGDLLFFTHEDTAAFARLASDEKGGLLAVPVD